LETDSSIIYTCKSEQRVIDALESMLTHKIYVVSVILDNGRPNVELSFKELIFFISEAAQTDELLLDKMNRTLNDVVNMFQPS